jgi:signal transduction histidine kinase
MFRRPWQIWLAYLLILTLMLSGFAWLTVRVVELDARERLARAEADQEEKVRLALWRMESVAMPIIAAEAARPYLAYEPYYVAPGGGPADRVASPLLRLPSEYVLLNFEIRPDGQVKSPQCPTVQDQSWACENGSTLDLMTRCCPRVEELQKQVQVPELLSQLPAETISTLTVVGSGAGPDQFDSQYVQNTNAIDLAAIESSRRGAPPERVETSTKEFASRSAKLQSYAKQEALTQRQQFDADLLRTPVWEGTSRPVWLGNRLLLARRVTIGSDQVIQGCWLNWDRLRTELQAELADLLPTAALEIIPASDSAPPGRSLASIPVQLIPPPLQLAGGEWTPTRIALVAAWGSLSLASLALAVLLNGVASLSERRAAFVSAVTHELRTPLTTLQLYSEMLNSGMVGSEEQRGEYVQTLQRESSRLGHLVDNVLALSRLERRTARRTRETLSVQALLDRAEPRLRARADQSQRPLVVTIAADAAGANLCVEPTVIEQILLNLVDNGCKYGDGDDRTLRLGVTRQGSHVAFRVRDGGPGLTAEARRKLFRPFSKSDIEAARSAPGLGLGLALSRELARGERGDLSLDDSGMQGATFVLQLPIA